MTQAIDIQYNSARENIRIPEYGRGIQELLQHACTIEDDYKRQKTVESIINMMQILNPNHRGIEDYRERLWNHAFAIAGPQLNVKAPEGIVIRAESERPKPEPLPYPAPNGRFRHYGSSVQKLMEKAIEMPDGVKKEGFVEVIASYMKLAYKTWSKEHYVSDDQVKEDLIFLSEGQLSLHEGHSSLDTLSISAIRREKEMLRQQRAQKYKQLNKRKKNNNNSGGGGNSGGPGGGGNRRKWKKK